MHPQTPRDLDGAEPRADRSSSSARPLLLGLALASAFWLVAPRAHAACDPDTPPLADGGSVTCTGTDETGFDASAFDDVDVTTAGTTTIDDSGAEAAGIVVGNGGSVTLGVDSTVNVVDANGVGVQGGDDVDVDLDGTINVNVADGTGVRLGSNTVDTLGGAPTLEIQNNGDINLNQNGGVGIDVTDNYDVTNAVGGTITVTGDDGVAIRGVDDNIVRNNGTIVLDGDNGRAIQINENTGEPLPNGAITDGTVTVNGANGIVIETGDNTGTLLDGTIDLLGTNGRGLSSGDKSNPTAQANHTNLGTLNVAGDDSIGLELGDGWISGSGFSTVGDVRNGSGPSIGTINVSGANAIGIRLGDDAANPDGDQNSFAVNGNGSVIDVTGTDGVAVSLGGNDFLTNTTPGLDNVHSFENAGTVMGDQDAGPLVLFRNSFGTFENRVLNQATGAITADLTDAGMMNRGIAVQGTSGVERVTNQGAITGDLFFGAGDDFFDNELGATYTGTVFGEAGNDNVTNRGTITGDVQLGGGMDVFDITGGLSGTVDLGADDDQLFFGPDASIGGFAVGGAGNDTLTLLPNGGVQRQFDLSRIATFETVIVDGSFNPIAPPTGWELQNGGGFTGLLDVRINGAVEADGTTPVALSLGGDVNNAGAIRTELILGNAGHTFTNTASGLVEGITRFGTGADLFDNAGSISADVFLGDGDDTYRHAGSAFIDTIATIDGEGGTNTAILGFDATSANSFDLARLANFATVRLEGDPMAMTSGGGWALTDGAGFMGTVEVSADSLLRVDAPTTIGGNLMMFDGAELRLVANASGTALALGGTATFDGELEVVLPASISDGTFTLIDATGGRGGSTFDTLTLPAASGIRTYSEMYTPNGIDLIVASAGGFGDPSVAFTANNQAIGAYFDRIDGDPGTSTNLQTGLDLFASTDGSLNNILTAISPEIYDAHTSLVLEGGRRISRLLLGRPRDCTPGQLDPWQGTTQPVECHARAWAPWVSGVGSFRNRDGFDGHPEYDARMGGLVFGLDAPSIGGFDSTLAISAQRGTLSFDQGGHSNLTLAEISGHGSWSHGPLRVQGVASWAYTRHHSTRTVFMDEGTGTTRVLAGANLERNFASNRMLLAGEVGLLFDVGPFTVEPIAAVDWMWIDTEGFTETSRTVFDASVESRDDDVLTTRTGIRVGTVYEYRRYVHRYLEWATGVWRPTVEVRWRQTISGAERDVSARLNEASPAIQGFTVQGKEDDGGVEIGTAISFVPKYANRLQLQLRYDAYRSENTLDHDLVGKIRIGF